jgi:hypothetical protein
LKSFNIIYLKTSNRMNAKKWVKRIVMNPRFNDLG